LNIYFKPQNTKIKFKTKKHLSKGSLSFFKKLPKIYQKSDKTTTNRAWEYLKKGFLWGTSFGLIFLVFYIVIFSPVFRIRKITIIENQRTDSSNLIQAAHKSLEGQIGYIFPKDNLIFFNQELISQELKSKNVAIDQVEISVDFPAALVIKIKEKERKLIWQNQQRYFEVDKSGIIFNQLDINEVNSILASPDSKKTVINDENLSISFKIGDRAAEQSFIDFSIQLPETLEKYTTLTIKQIVTPNPATREIHLYTERGWLIKLDTSRDIIHEIKVLNKVIQEKLTSEQLEKIAYLDLRVKGRVYYKFK
jgi:cell division septal protein FtsQ